MTAALRHNLHEKTLGLIPLSLAPSDIYLIANESADLPK
jgi:hypothetical protein